MRRGVKITLASLVLGVGVGVAMLFPRGTVSPGGEGTPGRLVFRNPFRATPDDAGPRPPASEPSIDVTPHPSGPAGGGSPSAATPPGEAPSATPPQMPPRFEPSSLTSGSTLVPNRTELAQDATTAPSPRTASPAAPVPTGRYAVAPTTVSTQPTAARSAALVDVASRIPSGVAEPPGPAATPPRRSPRTHTIVDGDSLRRIAQRYLGDAERHTEVFAANRGVLTDPELLPIGVKIVIPTDSPPVVESGASAPSPIDDLVPVRVHR